MRDWSAYTYVVNLADVYNWTLDTLLSQSQIITTIIIPPLHLCRLSCSLSRLLVLGGLYYYSRSIEFAKKSILIPPVTKPNYLIWTRYKHALHNICVGTCIFVWNRPLLCARSVLQCRKVVRLLSGFHNTVQVQDFVSYKDNNYFLSNTALLYGHFSYFDIK